MLIERHPTPNFFPGREGHRPRGIVVHTNAGSFSSTVAWFASPESGTSSHYLVGLDGTVAQFVDEADTARHAGRVHDPSSRILGRENPNLFTIGIEFEDRGRPHGVYRTDEQYRAGARLIRGIADRWGIPIDREHVVGHREIFAQKTCPGNLNIDRLIAAPSPTPDPPLDPRRVVCLLPVRNSAADLPDYLESVARFADAVVALDDGSNDDTRVILESNPLVAILLTNPPRESFAGWHDGENRNRLLAAAAELDPEWIVCLDADERIDADDAEALGAFLRSDALPGLAYGFQHFRMWGENRFDPEGAWVYRLFAFEPGQRFPDQQLHFNPVPTSIPRNAWVRTSVRLVHLGASDETKVAARLARYREADPGGEYPTDFGRLDRAPEGELPLWTARDPLLPIILGPEEDDSRTGRSTSANRDSEAEAPGEEDRATLVCLLPARNCEEDLPGYFESVARFADAVVALDDGSTDGTLEILEAEPLVKVLLARPRRPDYRGWDDAANRSALLEGSGRLNPRWLMSLDADERIDADDAAALRAFVERDADAGFAYGFQVFRMLSDGTEYDRANLWVGRLFAYQPGQRFPDQRLHFVPVPSSIPPDRLLATTIRIQHLAGMTEGRRAARFAKYEEVDPDNAFQASYEHLVAPPGPPRPWRPRPPGMPVLVPRAAAPIFDGASRDEREVSLDAVAHEQALSGDDLAADNLDLDAPVLSAIVISRDDEDRIEQTVRSVVEQECPEPFEVIVVTSGTDRTADIVRKRFPDVALVQLDRPALPGQARNAGLSVARGDYVSFPGSHVVLPQGSLAARIRAHELGYPMVTGTTLNGNTTPAGWAAYFLDHSTGLPNRPSGELTTPPAHCSYDRQFLLGIGGFPEDMRAGEDTAVNIELCRRGHRPYRAQDITFVHRSPCTRLDQLLRHHFVRGRALGRIMLQTRPPGRRVLDRPAIRRMVAYLPIRMAATTMNVRQWGGPNLESVYRRVRPLVLAGIAAAWAGTLFELFRPAPGKLGKLFGTPSVTLAVAGLDVRDGYPVGRADVLLLARIELLRPRARVVGFPRDLLVEVPGIGLRRLNEAYFEGAFLSHQDSRAGMKLLERTIEDLVGIRVTGSVVVEFDGFRRLVDAMGGVEIVVPHDIHDEFIGEDGQRFAAHFTAGRQVMEGEQALLYARTRRSDGDTWRRQRHLDLAKALVEQAVRSYSPLRLWRIARAARAAIHTSLGVPRALAVVQAAARLRGPRIRASLITSPLVASEQTPEGSWVRTGDPTAIAAYVRGKLIEDRPDAPRRVPVWLNSR